MKKTKYLKIYKILVFCCILTLIFNFSLVNAEEASAPAETPTETPQESAPSTDTTAPADTAPEITTEEPVSQPETVIENPAETVTTEETTTQETPEPIVTEEPIIFDFSQPTEESATAPAENSSAPVSYDVPTEFIRNIEIKELTILAQWQMSNKTDDSLDNGVQFLPSGQFEVSKPITVCTLVADVNGTDSISSVLAQISYPKNLVKNINEAGEKIGCGQQKTEFNLEPIAYEATSDLICENLRNNNNNLLSWGSDKATNLVYSYENICGLDGLITKQAAKLYCAETALAYDDPAGDYIVKITAQNSSGNSVIGENPFKYLELTTFANDFTDIQYGLVKANEIKISVGDDTFSTDSQPSVRNNGNTRLNIKIWQNDFGLGKTNGEWNLTYQAKVGNADDFISYQPEQTTILNNPVELGQTAKIDFGVLINRFPEANDKPAYAGMMTLSADKTEPLGCE